MGEESDSHVICTYCWKDVHYMRHQVWDDLRKVSCPDCFEKARQESIELVKERCKGGGKVKLSI